MRVQSHRQRLGLPWLSKIKKHTNNSGQTYVVVATFLFILAMLIFINYQFRGGWQRAFGIYGSVMITYLLGKMLLSFFYRPYANDPPKMKVSVFIPSYNEKPQAVFETIKSVLMQDYPVHQIFFVDDGSSDVRGYNTALKFKRAYDEVKRPNNPELIVHRLPHNSGKRAAQSWGFTRATGDIFFTVDSDGYVYPNALTELMKPFADDDVMSVTGKINARNKNVSLFTKLLDMRYDNAFRVERAAQSVTGNVLVCSGPISCHRRSVVMSNIDHYTNQVFLGEIVQSGDDRCLTNYGIKQGKTVFQSTAHCDTDVPETIPHFLKQQIRWNKSFFRESLAAFSAASRKPFTLMWVLLEMLLWILFGFVVVVALLFQVSSFGWVLGFYYFVAISLSAYARNVHYVVKRPFVFLAAPVYGIIHLVLLFPLRFYALITIKQTSWGTRTAAGSSIPSVSTFWSSYIWHLNLAGTVIRHFILWFRPTRLVNFNDLQQHFDLLKKNKYERLARAFHYSNLSEEERKHALSHYFESLTSEQQHKYARAYAALLREHDHTASHELSLFESILGTSYSLQS